ncbi:MAG: RluA family pseudouridine synthase [Clostridia bacterium]|nr:RluA family pseudouridine synthase [Clostridia bacterium]
MTSSQFTADAPLRVDIFLSERTGLTRSNIKKLCENGHVTVAGKPARAGQVLRIGEEVSLTVPDPVPIAAKAEDIPLDIVYEDEDLAVINKPQGMTVHAGAGNYEGTLVNALLFRLDSLSGINGELRPGIVHRIDKDTSGLLVVAKNDTAHLSLSKQIEEKSCKREYLALLEGVLEKEKGQVATDIGRDPKDRLRMAVVPAGTGRRAVTDYTVERRFRSHTLVRFSLQTGRTHQIRVHAKHLGHPVVGDMTYGYKKQRFQLSGQLLHAYRLELTHPRTGERMQFSAPLPDYFKHVLEVLEKTEPCD